MINLTFLSEINNVWIFRTVKHNACLSMCLRAFIKKKNLISQISSISSNIHADSFNPGRISYSRGIQFFRYKNVIKLKRYLNYLHFIRLAVFSTSLLILEEYFLLYEESNLLIRQDHLSQFKLLEILKMNIKEKLPPRIEWGFKSFWINLKI